MEEKIKSEMKRNRRKKKYPLPRGDMSFENEIAVLKAIYEFSNMGEKPITYKDVKVPNVHSTRISSEFNFLASMNLIAQGKKRGEYTPTRDLIDFVNNLNWKKEAEAKSILRKILLGSWFGDLTRKFLRTKREIFLEDLINELGKEAHAHPEKDKKAIQRLIEWLKYAEIIKIDENNKVKLKEPIQLPQREIKEEKIENIKPLKEKLEVPINVNISFLIDVNPDMKKEDIINIIKTIKDALKEVKR